MIADLLNISLSHYRDLLKVAKTDKNWYAAYRYLLTQQERAIQ